MSNDGLGTPATGPSQANPLLICQRNVSIKTNYFQKMDSIQEFDSVQSSSVSSSTQTLQNELRKKSMKINQIEESLDESSDEGDHQGATFD